MEQEGGAVLMNKKKLIYGSIIGVVLLAMYLPILVLVYFSFSETRIMNFADYQFGFGLYRDLLRSSHILIAVFNTFFVAVIAAAIATLIGTMAAVGIQNMRKAHYKGAVMALNLIPIINATIVTSFSLMLFFVASGIFGGYVRLIMAHIIICLPIAVLIIIPRLKSLDKNLFDAATDLGAKPMHAFFSVVVPQLMPVMISAFLVGFTLSLGDFIITQYNNEGIQTISTLVFNATRGPVPAVYRALTSVIFFAVMAVLIVVNIRVARQSKKRKTENY